MIFFVSFCGCFYCLWILCFWVAVAPTSLLSVFKFEVAWLELVLWIVVDWKSVIVFYSLFTYLFVCLLNYLKYIPVRLLSLCSFSCHWSVAEPMWRVIWMFLLLIFLILTVCHFNFQSFSLKLLPFYFCFPFFLPFKWFGLQGYNYQMSSGGDFWFSNSC